VFGCIIFLLLCTTQLHAHNNTIHHHFEQACAHMQNGQLDNALTSFKNALAINEHAPIHFNCGLILEHKKKYQQALEHFNRALILDPQYNNAYFYRGKCYAGLGKDQQAKRDYLQALTYHPSWHEIYFELGNIYIKLNDIDQAINYFYRAHHFDPCHISTLTKLGFYLINSGRLQEGLHIYKEFNNLFPGQVNVMQNIAYALSKLNRREEALPYYEQALAINPAHESALFGYAKALLAVGRLSEAWQPFEYRAADPKKRRDIFGNHLLCPEDFTNKTVLLRSEWGFGDMMQFIRYAQLIKQYNATVILRTFAPLVPLFSLCDFIDRVITKDDPFPECDLQIPVLSLPMIFNTSLETIPANIPYLQADKKLIEEWKERLAPDSNVFKIGICWHAKPIDHIEKFKTMRRTIPLACFAPLAELERVQLYSLQKVHGEEELNDISFAVHSFGADFDESHGAFMDTAAVIKHLDLVISADTSIVHLAGALGQQIWVLLPYTAEWRWLHDRTDSPWYPNNMRLFRQTKPGDQPDEASAKTGWESVMQEVQRALKKLIQEKTCM